MKIKNNFKLFVICNSLLLSVFSADAQTESLGVQFDDLNYSKIAFKDTVTRADSPPDCSLQRHAPAVGKQQNVSNSLAWAFAYALTIREAKQKRWTHPEDIQTLFYSPTYLYYRIKKETDKSCTQSLDLWKAIQTLKENTFLRDRHWQTDCPSSIPDSVPAKTFKMAPSVSRISNIGEKQGASVKNELLRGNPVIVVLENVVLKDATLVTTVNAVQKHVLSFKPAAAGQPATGYPLCVVGYDDNIFGKVGGGAFLVLNAQGITWGEKGYAWIRYDDFERYTRYALQLSLPKR